MKLQTLFCTLAGIAFTPLLSWAQEPAYQKAGLTSYQAAAHLLSRMSYGARPGQVEAVVHQGLDRWLEGQLQGRPESAEFTRRLALYQSLELKAPQIQSAYLAGPALRKMAAESGMMIKDQDLQKQVVRRKVLQMARQKGLKTEAELMRELVAQKVTRAVYSENQLQEVMCDFWFNHFNVSRTTAPARSHILSYERDVIRPQALGQFRPLLGATARHPAMLLYLNNAQSMADKEAPSLGAKPRQMMNSKRVMGVNENYARELMELHTLGVDGGYSQKDITEVARVLTGWTTLPRGGPAANRINRWLEQNPQSVERDPYGFIFAPFLHDSGSKKVLGTTFAAGGGVEEGERLLDLLARHPKTSERIARKFAVRFVSDEPDPKLVAELTQVFRGSGGDSKAMLRYLVDSPAFWSQSALRAKVKNPLEYCVSAVRILDGQLPAKESEIPRWVEKMGQSMYACVPPTGYPDRSEQWISSGTLVHRVNYAFALSSQQVRGVRVPNLPQGKLEQTAARLLPGRSLSVALGPVKQTLGNEEFFRGLAKENRTLTQNQKMVGVLLSSPEFQRR